MRLDPNETWSKWHLIQMKLDPNETWTDGLKMNRWKSIGSLQWSSRETHRETQENIWVCFFSCVRINCTWGNQYWCILWDEDIAPIFITTFHFYFSCDTRETWLDMLTKLEHSCKLPFSHTRYYSYFPSTMNNSVSCNHNLGHRTV